MSPNRLPKRQRGMSLLESLIAFVVLAVGMVALARLHTGLRASAEAARERSEAVRLAQLDIEQLRAFAGTAGWNAIGDASPVDVTPPGGTIRYTLERAVQTRTEPPLKAVQVTLHWNDRHGTARQLRIATLIAGQDPALSGALTLPRPSIVGP